MVYQLYKKSRDMAWETFINCKINSLLVNLMVIAKYYNIKIVKYSESKYVKKLDISDTDGFSVYKPI